MFCPKCGLENSSNSTFCKQCGTKIAVTTTQPTTQVTLAQIQSTSQHIKSPAPAFQPKAKNFKTLCWISFLLHIIILILWFFPLLSSLKGYKTTIGDETYTKITGTITSTMFEFTNEISVVISAITIVLMLLSALFSVLPIFTKSLNKNRFFILPKILTISKLSVFSTLSLITFIDALQYKNYNVICGPTPIGFVYLFCLAALIIILFVATRKIPKNT